MRRVSTVEITIRSEERVNVPAPRDLGPVPAWPEAGLHLLVSCQACGAREGEDCRKFSPLRRSEGLATFTHTDRLAASIEVVLKIRRELFGDSRMFSFR